MSQNIFVTGASGFVGTAITQELVTRGYKVRALVNHRPAATKSDAVQSLKADLFNPAALKEAMTGCDAVIHLVGIIYENAEKNTTYDRLHVQATRNVVDAAVAAGVTRYIHMSALGARPDAEAEYHKTKFKAEQYVAASSLKWTVFRPSVIHGPGGEFMQMESAWVHRAAPPYYFMPYFSTGVFGFGRTGLLHPVYVNDVARAFADALTQTNSVNQTYCLGGTDRINWPRLHQMVSWALIGSERWTLGIPAWFAKLLTDFISTKKLGFNFDQVVMSLERLDCDLHDFRRDFGWTPRGFAETLQQYSKELNDITAEALSKKIKKSDRARHQVEKMSAWALTTGSRLGQSSLRLGRTGIERARHIGRLLPSADIKKHLPD